MKLFAAGPTQMDNETLNISKNQLPYYRTTEFSDINLYCDITLKKLLGTSDTTKSMILTASGTAAMEAAVLNIFNKKDKILVINGGTFGERFVKLCLENYNIPYEELKIPNGIELSYEMLERYENKNFTGMLVNISETSIGQIYDINIISEFCKKENICLVVDAISAFLVDPYYMDKYNIDATIISSQKGLGLAPGLSMLYINEKTYKNRVEKNEIKSMYLNFNNYCTDILRGQTPYTPAVGIIIQLEEKLKRLEKMGIEKIIAHSEQIANYFRKNLQSTGLNHPNYRLSNGVTPVLCKDNNAQFIVRKLIDNFDIFVVPSPGDAKNSMFRVGHMGLNYSTQDIDMLISSIKSILLKNN